LAKINSAIPVRSSLKQLQDFTRSGLELDLENSTEQLPLASAISISVGRYIHAHFNGSRTNAIRTLFPEMLRQPEALLLRKNKAVSRRTLENWCLLFGMMPDFKKWQPGRKKDFFLLVQAKRTGEEQTYNLLLKKNRFLQIIFIRIAEPYASYK
jgi:hypothetical protein